MKILSSRQAAFEAWSGIKCTSPGRSRDGSVRFDSDLLYYFNTPIARKDSGTGWILFRKSFCGAHVFNDYIPYYVPGFHINGGVGSVDTEEQKSRLEKDIRDRYPGSMVHISPPPPGKWTPTAVVETWNSPASNYYVCLPTKGFIYTYDLDLPISLDSVLAYWKKETEHVLYRMRWKSSRMRWAWHGKRFQSTLQLQLAVTASRFGVPTPLDWFSETDYNALLIRFDDKKLPRASERYPWTICFKNQYDS